MDKTNKEKIVKVLTYKGSRYTIIVSKITDDFITGIDKFDIPIKLEMVDIKEIIPLSKVY